MTEPQPAGDLPLAAFRDLHGARLHGFALVVLLGDRRVASDLAADALATGAMGVAGMRHPERAAAALRARIVKVARRLRPRPTLTDERAANLAHLGIDGATAAALARLTLVERAALLASQLEGFAEDDVATILDLAPAQARRAVADVRRKYLSRHRTDIAHLDDALGQIADRVREAAARAMGTGTP